MAIPNYIMIIRHAEKQDPQQFPNYMAIDQYGAQDPGSLITLGWARSGAIIPLFVPFNPASMILMNPPSTTSPLPTPNAIFAASDTGSESARPMETVLALSNNLGIKTNLQYKNKDYSDMVSAALASGANAVLICWHHENILSSSPGADDGIVNFINTTTQSNLPNLPTQPWPGDRFDMVLILSNPNQQGQYTQFTQVPQMLMAGDQTTPFQ